MGLENFTPSLWSAKLFVRLRKALVFASVVNTDYEGEIRAMGDSVRINEVGPVTVSDYSKDIDLTWATLTSAQKMLIIDQAKSFSFEIDDIDAAQNNPKVMAAAMAEAAYSIADTVDQFIAGLYAGAAAIDSTNMGSSSSPISLSSGNVIATLSYAARKLSELDVPNADRWMIVPPWVHQKLLLAEVGGISATAVPKVNDNGPIMNGFIGQALGFNMLVSNNGTVLNSTTYTVLAGNRSAISYAGQISKVEAVRRESRFADGVKGLYLYGGKVVNPDALACLYLSEVSG